MKKYLNALLCFAMLTFVSSQAAIIEPANARMSTMILGGGVPSSSCGSGSEDLSPASTSQEEWADWSNDGTHHTSLDDTFGNEQIGSGQTVNTNFHQGTYSDQYTLSDTGSMMGGTCTTSTVVVKLYTSEDGGDGGELDCRLYVNSGWVDPDGGSQTVTTDYGSEIYYDFTFTQSWTAAQMDAASVEVSLTDDGYYDVYLSNVIVRVSWND